MTVSSETIRILYDGDGETIVFPYTWKIYATTDLKVVYRDSAGAETTLTLNTHYTVSGAGNPSGGNVTLIGAYAANPPAEGTKILVILDLPFTQSFDYVENDPFPAESHEDLADKAVKLCQILKEQLGRTLKIPITSSETDIEISETVLEAIEQMSTLFDFEEADIGKLIKVNATGDGFTTSGVKEEAAQFDFGSKKLKTTGNLEAANVENNADVTDAENVEDAITGQGAVTDPTDAGVFAVIISAVLKKITWANIKATLKTYFDTVYAAISHASKHTDGTDDIQSATSGQKGLATAAQITKLNGIETAADVTDAENVEDAITGAGAETDPEDVDLFPTVVSSVLKKITWANILTALRSVLYVPRTYIWYIPGTVTVDTEQSVTYKLKRACTVEDVELHVQTAPTGQSLIVDINEDGVSLFSTRPEIDAGSTTEDDNHVFSDTALAAGSELTADVDQIGSTVAGERLTVRLHVKEFII